MRATARDTDVRRRAAPRGDADRTEQSGGNDSRAAKIEARDQPVAEICQAAAVAAIDTVIRILTDPAARPNDRLRAANMVLERAYGRPRAQVSIEAAASVVAAFIASLGDRCASALGGERQSASREQPAAATARIAADGAHGVTQESTGSTPHEPPEAHSLGAP